MSSRSFRNRLRGLPSRHCGFFHRYVQLDKGFVSSVCGGELSGCAIHTSFIRRKGIFPALYSSLLVGRTKSSPLNSMPYRMYHPRKTHCMTGARTWGACRRRASRDGSGPELRTGPSCWRAASSCAFGRATVHRTWPRRLSFWLPWHVSWRRRSHLVRETSLQIRGPRSLEECADLPFEKEFECGWYGVDVACGHTSVPPIALMEAAARCRSTWSSLHGFRRNSSAQ